MSQDESIDFKFLPSDLEKDSDLKLLEGKEGKQLIKLTSLLTQLKNAVDKTNLKSWEITLEGYLEASSGILPGGKTGFKASITLSNQ